MSSLHRNDLREHAVREGGGLEISLRWRESVNRVKVSVLDQRHKESFDIYVAGAHALSAFYDPFAYAAGLHICFSCALYDALDLQPQY